MSPHPSHSTDDRKSLLGSRAFHRVIVILVLAAIVGVALTRSKPGRLDRAIAAAAKYEMIDGPPPRDAVDLGTVPATLGDWIRRFASGEPEPASAGDLSEEGVAELLRFGDEVAAACTPPGRVKVEIAYETVVLNLIDFLTAAKLLVSIAEGNVPSVGLDERFGAVLTVLHLSQALTERHLAGLFVGGVMMELARDGFEACVADGLLMTQAQRAELVSALEAFDFKGDVSLAHRAVIARVRSAKNTNPLTQSSRWRRITDRVMGRAFDDQSLCLELAVATQQKLHGEESAAGRKARMDLATEIRGLNRASYRHAHLAAKLDNRVDMAQGWADDVAAWLLGVRP